MDKNQCISKSVEITPHVSLCGEGVIEISGQKLKANRSRAYVEFRLSHSFPVVTSDGTALHPNTVANSHETMMHQVFNVAHIMRAYDPEENARDRILGTVVGVEFTGKAGSRGKHEVQADRAKAAGLRCVAVVHKAAEWADKILGQHLSGRKKWTVSMEAVYYLEDSGFLVKDTELAKEFETPSDLLDLGWTYVPYSAAPAKLLECLDEKKGRIKSQWGRRDVVLLECGLDGEVHYQGVGITPLGKEPEAEILTMMASGVAAVDLDPEEATLKLPSIAKRLEEERLASFYLPYFRVE